MTGCELSRRYFEEFGLPMLKKYFPDLLPLISVGFTGRGSDHYGFDDEISRDHDFEPGFSVFLPGEDRVGRRQAFLLERAYSALPGEYLGVRRERLSPVGGNRHGVFRIPDYFTEIVGYPNGSLPPEAWLSLPEYALFEAVNGEIFYDGSGEITGIRKALSSMPRDYRLKRIAGGLLLMAQSGQYNYARCLRHGEKEAAALALHEFTVSSMKTFFHLKERYMPYYKWSFRALRELPGGDGLASLLAPLLFEDLRLPDTASRNTELIEEISSLFISELRTHNLLKKESADLEVHAYSVNDAIEDGNIRNLHILSAV